MKKHWTKLVTVSVFGAFYGCQSGNQVPSDVLVVVEQTDSVRGNNGDNNCDWASITIDVPVNGPQVLKDSVMALVNNELYKFCEYCIEFADNPEEYVAYSQEELFSDDGERLLSHYMEKYKPLMEDRLWNTFGLTLKLEAQTGKYVTYGLLFYHCGGSCGSEKLYYTFDKHDGHLVKEIISHNNLVRFFEDYPEYAHREDYCWNFSSDSEYRPFDYGLLDDHFSLVIEGNHYFTVDITYSQLFSYLSPEVQALLERQEENVPMLPAYLPERSEDGEVWMEVDTVNYALVGFVRTAGAPLLIR